MSRSGIDEWVRLCARGKRELFASTSSHSGKRTRGNYEDTKTPWYTASLKLEDATVTMSQPPAVQSKIQVHHRTFLDKSHKSDRFDRADHIADSKFRNQDAVVATALHPVRVWCHII